MVNLYLRVFSFSLKSRGFWVLLRSRSPDNPFRGSWCGSCSDHDHQITPSEVHGVDPAQITITTYPPQRFMAWILLRSRSPDNLFGGSWFVTTMTFGEPMTSIRHFSNAHAIAAASSSIGAYLLSVSVQNLLPAYIRCQPSEQQIGALSMVHWQCFCRSRKPIPSLLQSGARQVTLYRSG